MKDLDNLIISALSQRQSRPQAVNNKILLYRKTERDIKMKKSVLKKTMVTLAMVVLRAVPVYRAAKFLMPSQVAEKKGDLALAKAFESQNAITVNETQQSGGYDITLLGIVSGKDISDSRVLVDDRLYTDKTYRVVAVQNSDGTPFKDIADTPEMLISPYFKGANPIFINIMSLNGGYFSTVVDGVMYRLINCDNIEAFAGGVVYLGVSDGMMYNRDAYIYNSNDGTITQNPDYDGVKALFNLPLDTSKADPDKAREIIKSIVG